MVFGAGASLDNAQRFERSERNPPLDNSFFEKIRELEIEVPEELRAYARKLPGGSPFEAAHHPVRMEEFFKELFFDFTREGESDPRVAAAYKALIEIYRKSIARTTDWMNVDCHAGGPVGEVIERAVKNSDQVTLITFNQDLVLENEIFKRPDLRERWCIKHGYGTFSHRVEMMRRRGKGLAFDHHGATKCDGGKRLRILKLHGSLNWLVRINGREPSPRLLSGASINPSPVQVTRRREVPPNLRYKGKKGSARPYWYMWPILVPPVYNKQVLIRRFLAQVWDDAQDALSVCERLILYGYSMPPADIEAELLFQRAIFVNPVLSGLEVIDPDPEAAGRYARLASKKPLRWFPSSRDFLDDESLSEGRHRALSSTGSG